MPCAVREGGMPPKKVALSMPSCSDKCKKAVAKERPVPLGGRADAFQGLPPALTESLLATDDEKQATSRSLYGDHAARISGNLIHIHDRVRQRAYEAIFRHISDKTVLNLGCGMGLYAMLAARSRAQHVVAVDASAIVDAARVVAARNGLRNITFLRGRLREVLDKLPLQQYDVVLCEWMGALVLNEDVLTDVLYARDHLLRPGGVVCPDSASFHVAGVSDYAFRLDTEDFWSNVYGFRMEPMKELVRHEVEVCSIPAANIVTSTARAHTLTLENLPHLTSEEVDAYERGDAAAAPESDNPIARTWTPCRAARAGFAADFAVRATRNTTIHYLTFYVSAAFASQEDPGANFVIGIRPGGVNPWTEVSVALTEALPVIAGEIVSGSIRVYTPAGKTTLLEVRAKTEGKVAAVETWGKYCHKAF